MYITCQQCSTIFRLDESLLKPAGSKVRCSQCRNVFVEYPPASEADVSLPAGGAAIQAEADTSSEAVYDQELEGIDLDELDAIFEQGDVNALSPTDDSEVQAAELDDEVPAELDDQDLEMDFELEPESAEAVQVEEVAVEDAGDNLDDLDLELDFELEADKPEEVQTSTEIESSVDEISEDMGLDLDDLDFSLDDDMAEAVDADADTDTEAGEKVDLIDNPDEDASDMDLDDGDDFDLDIDLSDDPSFEEPEGEEEKGDEFDLAELDDMLGGKDTSGKVSAGVTRDVIDENAELALDDTPSDEMALDADSAEDASEGLELSDLDAMLDGVDGQAGQDAQMPEDEVLGAGQDTEAASDEDADLEDLDFELDAEFEDKAIADDSGEDAELEQAQDEEIDLSDIEQMLGEDDDPLDTQQLEADFLGLDSDSEEKWSEGDAPEMDLDDTDEIDLNEIEAAIDDADSGLVEDTIRMGDPEDEELSLDESSSIDDGAELELDDDIILELEDDDAEPEDEEMQALDDDLDLSDLDLGEEPASEDVGEMIDAGDIELEFQVEDDPPATGSVEAPAAELETQDAPQDFSIEDTVPAPPVDETLVETELSEPQKTKKSSSKGLLFILIALLLGGAGYLYYAIAYQGMDIPYVSQYLKPKPKDPAGIFKLFTTDINSKFVDTENSGRLFVIEGQVRNGYSAGRQMIRLQGKLYTKGKVLAKSEFAYAGVSISDQALNSQPVADLKKRLNSGIAQGAATMVNPGGKLPFMIIFSELPDELDEFAIEAISSMPSK